MKVSIFGSGKIARVVAQDLSRENNEVKIYVKEERENKALFDIAGVNLIIYRDYEEIDGYLSKLSKEEGILLLEEEDQENLVLARILSGLTVKPNLLIHDPQKAILIQKHPELFGHSNLFCPSLLLGKSIQKLYYEDEGLSTEVFEEFQLSLLKYPVEDQIEFVDRKIKDIGAFEDLVVVGIKRGNQTLIPNGQTLLMLNDRLHLTGTIQAIRRFKRRHHIYRDVAPQGRKKFIIFGTNEKSLAIGRGLLEKEADITFIGRESFSPKKWSEIFPQAIYRNINEKGLPSTFDNLDLSHIDGFISSSSSDGDNVLAVLAAYSLGVKNSVLFVEDESMLSALDTEKVSAVYTTAYLLSQKIKRSLRGPRDLSFHLLSSQMEIYEIRIKKKAEAVGKTIEELELPKGFLIGGILRQGEKNLIPKGNVRLEQGDEIIVFILPEAAYAIRKFLAMDKNNLFTELLSIY